MANSIHGLSNLDSIGQPTLLFTAAAIRNSDLLNGLQIDTLTSSQITQLQARAGHFDTPIAAVHQRCLDAAGGAQQNVTGNRAAFILTAGADALTDADIALACIEDDVAARIYGFSKLKGICQPTLLFAAAAVSNSDLLTGLQIDTLTGCQITQLQACTFDLNTPFEAFHQRRLATAGGAQQNIARDRLPLILTAGADALTDADIALVGLERDVATGIDKLLNVDRLTGNDAQVTPGPHALQVNLASNFKAQITACFGNTCDIQVAAQAHHQITPGFERVGAPEQHLGHAQVTVGDNANVTLGLHHLAGDISMALQEITVGLQEDVLLETLRPTKAQVAANHAQFQICFGIAK